MNSKNASNSSRKATFARFTRSLSSYPINPEMLKKISLRRIDLLAMSLCSFNEISTLLKGCFYIEAGKLITSVSERIIRIRGGELHRRIEGGEIDRCSSSSFNSLAPAEESLMRIISSFSS